MNSQKKLGLALIICLLPMSAMSGQLLKFYVNRVKQTCQCPNCDLQGADLHSFKPGSSSPTENNFAATIANPTLADNCWLSCDFSNAKLNLANLNNANFTACIRGYETPLKSANFTNANLQDAALSMATFAGISFKYANLQSADLSGSSFYLVDFQNADLTHANLQNATSSADAMHGWGSQFIHTNFSFADLRGSSLYGCFENANFSHANLQNAKLSTRIDACNLSDNEASKLWQNVNFTEANLKGASLNPMDLSKAQLCHTIMPDGQINNTNCQ